MAELGAERRLEAILAADVAGYGWLMGRDDKGTLAAIKVHRKLLLDPAISACRGHIFKTTGDGLLVEFGSVVDAVRCAIAMQRGMTARNDGVPESERIVYRIGINIGDIIIDGNDTYGDGVNVAVRLEGLAEPGGLCISKSAFDQVHDKLPIAFTDLGERQVKHIARPLHVFGLTACDIAALPKDALWQPEAWAADRRPTSRSRRLAVIALGLSVVVVLAVSGSWFALTFRSWHAPADNRKPVLAVLPFANISGEPGQDYFSDGISESILTALSRSPYLLVIARNSSFRFTKDSVDVFEVAKVLGAGYILKGSAQKSGEQVRVTTGLIDAQTGSQVWAEQYDRPLSDIFKVQDEITGTIAAALSSRIQRHELDSMRSKATNFSAYDYFLQGRALVRNGATKEQLPQARELLEKAISLDPKFALAYAELARTYYREIVRRWNTQRREEAINRAFDLISQALELDPSLPPANSAMGSILLLRHAYAEAVNWGTKAIALDPNDPDNYIELANVYSTINRAEEALPLMQKAFRLDPLHPARYEFLMGRVLFLVKDFQGAIPYLRDCVRRLPDSWPCHLFLAEALAYTNQNEAAKREFEEGLRFTEFKSVAQYRAQESYQPGPQSEVIFEGLARLGLPLQ